MFRVADRRDDSRVKGPLVASGAEILEVEVSRGSFADRGSRRLTPVV